MSVFMRRNAFHQAAVRKRKHTYSERLGTCLAPEVTGHYTTCWNVLIKRQVTNSNKDRTLTLSSTLWRKSTNKMENTSSWASLTSKMKNHYNSSLKDYKKRRTSIFTPKIIEVVAVPLFFFTIIAAWLIGIADVLPKIYEESKPRVLLFQQLFVTLLFSEMMINWFCIRYVDSSIKTIQGLKSVVRRAISTDGSRDNSGQEEEHSAFIVDSHGNRTYPYWSRTPCFKCDVIRPPRCHHCPLCNICILKRDHHCFFAGSCVGWRNQRHFIVFCLWASLSCSYAFGHAIYYIYYELWSSISYFDLFAPVTIFRYLFGYVSAKVTLYVTVTTFLLYFATLSSTFFVEHMKLINAGKTSFEVDWVNKNLKIKDSRSFYDKLKGVLGDHVWLSVIFPVHFIFPPLDDPDEWPFVKVYRQP